MDIVSYKWFPIRSSKVRFAHIFALLTLFCWGVIIFSVLCVGVYVSADAIALVRLLHFPQTLSKRWFLFIPISSFRYLTFQRFSGLSFSQLNILAYRPIEVYRVNVSSSDVRIEKKISRKPEKPNQTYTQS